MRKQWLSGIVLAVASQAWAGWIEVGQEGASVVMVDATTVERQGGLARVWVLVNHPSPRRLVEVSYQSQKKHLEFRCASGESRVLATTLHGGAMGEGKVVYEDHGAKDWQAVDAGEGGARLRELACR